MDTNIYTPKKSQNSVIHYLDGATATGKSKAVCSHVRKFANYRNQIIICEKVSLLEEWQSKLIAIGLNPCLIHGDGASSKVSNWFQRHNDYLGTGVLLCTQAALSRVSRIGMKHECDVFFDELPTVCDIVAEKFHTNASIIKEHLKLGRSRFKQFHSEYREGGKRQRNKPDSLRKVVPVDLKSLTEYLKDSSNIVTDEVKRLFDLVVSDNHEVYVKELSFNRLGEVKTNSDDCHKGKTTFVSMMNDRMFKGWNTCTIISADFNLSLFKHWFSSKFRFCRNEFLYFKLENNGMHTTSWVDRTEFLYLIHPSEKRGNCGLVSKFWLESNGAKNGVELDRRLGDEFGEEPLLLCTNVSRSKRKFARQSNVTTITSKDIGTNEYFEFNNVVMDAALNLSPEAESILLLLDVPIEVVRLQNIYNVAYQVVSRSNLRTNRNGKTVKLCFADKPTCEYVMSRFSGKKDQLIKVRHIGDQKCQDVKVNPLVQPVEYSKSFTNRINRVIRMARLRARGTNEVIQHRLEHLRLRPSEAKRTSFRHEVANDSDSNEMVKNSGSIYISPQNAFGGACGTSSSTGNNSDSTGSNSEMVKNSGSIYIKLPEKLTISDLPNHSDWVAYFHIAESGHEKYQKTKTRKFINDALNNNLHLINPIVEGEHFFYANFAIVEFSSDQCSKVEFIQQFNPTYSTGDQRRLSFLISEQDGLVQVIAFFKSPAASIKRYRKKIAPVESILGFELEIKGTACRLQDDFEGFNCGRSRDLERHSL